MKNCDLTLTEWYGHFASSPEVMSTKRSLLNDAVCNLAFIFLVG